METIVCIIIILLALFFHPFVIKVLIMLNYGKYWREEWEEYKRKSIFLPPKE